MNGCIAGIRSNSKGHILLRATKDMKEHDT